MKQVILIRALLSFAIWTFCSIELKAQILAPISENVFSYMNVKESLMLMEFLCRIEPNSNMTFLMHHGPDPQAFCELQRSGMMRDNTKLIFENSCASMNTADGFLTSQKFPGKVIGTRPGYYVGTGLTRDRNCYYLRFFKWSPKQIAAGTIGDVLDGISVPSSEAMGVYFEGKLTGTKLTHIERLYGSGLSFYSPDHPKLYVQGSMKNIGLKPRIDWHTRLANRNLMPWYFALTAGLNVSAAYGISTPEILPDWTDPFLFVGSIYSNSAIETSLLGSRLMAGAYGATFSGSVAASMLLSVPLLAHTAYRQNNRIYEQARIETGMSVNYAFSKGTLDPFYFRANGEKTYIPFSLRTTLYCHSPAIQGYCKQLEGEMIEAIDARQDVMRRQVAARVLDEALPRRQMSSDQAKILQGILNWAQSQ